MTTEIDVKKRREFFRWATAALLSIVLFLSGYIINDFVDGGALQEHVVAGPHQPVTSVLEGIHADIEQIEIDLRAAALDRSKIEDRIAELSAAVSRLEGMLRAKGVVP